jgi:hypothetical protein
MKKPLILITSIFLLISCEVVQEETYCIIVDKMYQKSYTTHRTVNGIRRRHYHPERYLLITYSRVLEEEIHKEVSHDQYESLNVGDSIIHSYYAIKKK